MKKLLTGTVLGLVMLLTPILAFAENSTTVTVTVPQAEYVLSIPADQQIRSGDLSPSIGQVSVTESSGFADGKDLKVSVVFDEFTCETTDTTIPFKMSIGSSIDSTSSPLKLTFEGKNDGTVSSTPKGTGNYSDLYIRIDSNDWAKALAGAYKTIITYTAEVVKGQ